MKERGIIMAGWTTLAILRNQKRKTRRIAKRMPPDYARQAGILRSPYGQSGDRLWVRETWTHDEDTLEEARIKHEDVHGDSPIYYRAGMPDEEADTFARWRPSIHMPRWASRLTLDITDVRIERLQEISEEDAKAEGVARDTVACDHTRLSCEEAGCLGPTYRASFCDAWEGIHGDGSWEANPWVWVISFSRYKPGAG